eukprot:TRINITY_DN17582_c0_g1_i2.p1 TRINITY_DN17582_c0_g1~~TRINITY_DN17582_c0_g1_i2.p1  ORF type:complete len:474 (-),score=80.48 TRINITY_DN17582_c0_g1_i2:334-1755(-)
MSLFRLIGLIGFGRASMLESGLMEFKDLAHGQVECGTNLGVRRAFNKGAVGMGFRVGSSSLVLVGCHLTSDSDGSTRQQLRDRDLRNILGQMEFNYDTVSLKDFSRAHHHCILMGDLNYRVGLLPKQAIGMIQDQDWTNLLRAEELIAQREQGLVLAGWEEHPIKWPPTYRLQKNRRIEAMDDLHQWYTTEVASKATGKVSLRTPSYTDRILHHSIPGSRMTCQGYHSHPEMLSSDHCPVSASFNYHSTKPTTPELATVHVQLSDVRIENHRAPNPQHIHVLFPVPCEDELWHVRKLSQLRRAMSASEHSPGSGHQNLHPNLAWAQAASTKGVGVCARCNMASQLLLVCRLQHPDFPEDLAECTIGLRNLLHQSEANGNQCYFSVTLSAQGRNAGTLHGTATLFYHSAVESSTQPQANCEHMTCTTECLDVQTSGAQSHESSEQPNSPASPNNKTGFHDEIGEHSLIVSASSV